MTRLRVLSLTTLLPTPIRPGFGLFVASSLGAAARRGDVDLTIVNPIGIPPWPLSRREPYVTWARTPETTELAGAPVHHIRFLSLPKFADGNPARIVAAVLPLARGLHREAPFDVVDAQFFFPDGPVATAVAADLGLPLSIKARGSDIHYWATRPWPRRQILSAAQQAAGLLAVSAALRGDMIALGMPHGRIAVHYTGIDHKRFAPIPRVEARKLLPEIPATQPLYVATGGLVPVKAIDLAIEALTLLEEGHLAIAGDGPEASRLRALAAERGLRDRVHFLGQIDHALLPQLLSAADALVHPARSEGIANAWIEALACGTPVIVGDIGGAREIVTDNAAGRIVPRTPQGFASAMREISADPPDQATVAAHADRFGWERNGAELAGHWRRLAGR